jgi:hypothetical protein
MSKYTDKQMLDFLDKADGAIYHKEYGEYEAYFGGHFRLSAREILQELMEQEGYQVEEQ